MCERREGEGERERGIQCCLNKNPERMKGKRHRRGRRERASERRGKNTHAQKQLQKVEIFSPPPLSFTRTATTGKGGRRRGRKESSGFFFFLSARVNAQCVPSHSRAWTRRIPVNSSRSGGFDGVPWGSRRRGEESEGARLNHGRPVDPNFGCHFQPR